MGRPNPLIVGHGVVLDVLQGVGFVLPFDRRGHHATKGRRVRVVVEEMNRLPDKVLWEPRVDIFDQAGSNDCGILRRKQCLPLQCTQECKYIQEIDNGINGATHSVAAVEREREDGETGFWVTRQVLCLHYLSYQSRKRVNTATCGSRVNWRIS